MNAAALALIKKLWPVAVVLSLLAIIYVYHLRIVDKQHDLDLANSEVKSLQSSISDYQQKRTAADNLASKANEKLNAIQKDNDSLRDQLRSGTKRVYVKAQCSYPKNANGETGGVGDGPSVRLTESAQQDYATLLKMIATEREKTIYLQDFIRSQLGDSK
mgnify:CR=1 FL=1